MTMIELNTVKEHCRIDADFAGDDSLLEIYTGAAKRYVETWTRRKLYETSSDEGFAEDEDHLLLDDDIRIAMLLMIGHWYENREISVTGTISTLPLAVDVLLQPHRIYGV